jgi:hypothetical protein
MLSSVAAQWAFYKRAVTKYQLHSPMIFDLVMAVLEDSRQFYAFVEVELLRKSLQRSHVRLQVSGQKAPQRMGQVTLGCELSPAWGRNLFRLVQHVQSRAIHAVNPGLGLDLLYAATAVRSAPVRLYNSDPILADVCRAHFDILGLVPPVATTIPKENTLLLLQTDSGGVDSAQVCRDFLAASRSDLCIVVISPQKSEDVQSLWQSIVADERIRVSIGFEGFGVAFTDQRFVEKQHVDVVAAWKKPWMFM